MAGEIAPRGTLLRRTQGLCLECRKVVPALLERRDGDVWIVRTCADHGSAEALLWPDADLFQRFADVVGDDVWCRTLQCVKGEPCDGCLPKTYNIQVDVTDRCNLRCPVCCTDAVGACANEPSIDAIVSRLPPVKPGLLGRVRRPNVVLFGGEPTLREDLPDLVRAIVARGYIPRLATNGVRTDPAFLMRLREAGLTWVILQFDGFSDEVSLTLRGKAMVQHKLDAIERMSSMGFKVQLGTMLAEGVNTSEIGPIIRFLGRNPRAFWVNFYPHASQGRNGLPTVETPMSSALKHVERETGGRITVSDFVETTKWLGRLYRVLKSPNLRPKMSTLPMVLVFEGDEYYPLVRLFDPVFAARHAVRAAQVLAALPKLLLYQQEYTPPFIKFVVVEKFLSANSIDLEDASNCHMAFMTRTGLVPFDIHNVITRGTAGGGLEGAVP
jgi:uncharacterized radical SAM superfamily Fe-S cluster-containing enzyme